MTAGESNYARGPIRYRLGNGHSTQEWISILHSRRPLRSHHAGIIITPIDPSLAFVWRLHNFRRVVHFPKVIMPFAAPNTLCGMIEIVIDLQALHWGILAYLSNGHQIEADENPSRSLMRYLFVVFSLYSHRNQCAGDFCQ